MCSNIANRTKLRTSREETEMANEPNTSRRDFVAAIGAAVTAGPLAAATATAAEESAPPLPIIDFHNDYAGSSFTLTTLASVPPAARPTWERITANLQSQDLLLGSVALQHMFDESSSAELYPAFFLCGRHAARDRY